jgi:hypothetical protein
MKASLNNGWYIRQIKPGVVQRVKVSGGRKPRYQKKGRPTKLTEDQVHAIIALKPEKPPYSAKATALGQLLNISATTIHGIWSGKSWRHIQRPGCPVIAQYGRQDASDASGR